jgi:hypothetical protein
VRIIALNIFSLEQLWIRAEAVVMTLHRRIALTAVLMTCACTFLACTGKNPNGDGDHFNDNNGKPAVSDKNTGGTKAEARANARAHAEEEAALKNEADRKAYEAEVERLKAEYATKMEEYNAAKADYDVAMLAYNAAKREVEAARLLNLAREFDNPKGAPIANRRYREIVKEYPGSQAAKDAKVLLNGGYVALRRSPLEPMRPEAPVEPRLVLPRPPQPVAVEYPPDEDDGSAPVIAENQIPDKDYKSVAGGDYVTPIRLTNGKTVFVRGHFRNGHYVAPHMRSAPGTGSTSKASSGRRK